MFVDIFSGDILTFKLCVFHRLLEYLLELATPSEDEVVLLLTVKMHVTSVVEPDQIGKNTA